MNIFFLDVDGVFTSARTGWYNFDIYSVNFIRWLCREVDIKIVISSTWRKNHGKSFFESIFGEENIHSDWKTNWVNSSKRIERGFEIQDWLDSHPETTKYLILDDDSDMLSNQLESFIQTDGENGLLFEHFMKIRDYWGVKNFPVQNTPLYQNMNMFAFHNLQ